MPIPIKQFMRDGERIYRKRRIKGSLEDLSAWLQINGPKGDPNLYAWISALDQVLHEELPSAAEILDLQPQTGMNDEMFWSEVFLDQPADGPPQSPPVAHALG